MQVKNADTFTQHTSDCAAAVCKSGSGVKSASMTSGAVDESQIYATFVPPIFVHLRLRIYAQSPK